MALQIAMYRGDDKTFPFTLTQGGVAVDLTGATFRAVGFHQVVMRGVEITHSTIDGEIEVAVADPIIQEVRRHLLGKFRWSEPRGGRHRVRPHRCRGSRWRQFV